MQIFHGGLKNYRNADLPNIGKLVMKPVRWQKDWIPDMFQTCMWIGSQYPSHKSQRNWIAKGGGNGRGKEGGKGSGKGDKGDKRGKNGLGKTDNRNDQSRQCFGRE